MIQHPYDKNKPLSEQPWLFTSANRSLGEGLCTKNTHQKLNLASASCKKRLESNIRAGMTTNG